MLAALISLLCGGAVAAAPPPPVGYHSLTEPFAAFDARTAALSRTQRVTNFQREFNRLFPGFYEPRGRADYEAKLAEALETFPAIEASYRDVERRFPAAFSTAVEHFRRFFPGFEPPVPIWFVHSIGEMDGGMRDIEGHTVMVFGADMIAKYDRNRMQPFLDHELLHVENARYFPDCQPLWCTLWQEGLAVYAASRMNPGASDDELLLVDPKPTRAAVDQRWTDALCLTSAKMSSTEPKDLHAFFYLDGKTAALPVRFGYYIGYRLVQEAGRTHDLTFMAHLDHVGAKRLLADTLDRMLIEGHATCDLLNSHGRSSTAVL